MTSLQRFAFVSAIAAAFYILLGLAVLYTQNAAVDPHALIKYRLIFRSGIEATKVIGYASWGEAHGDQVTIGLDDRRRVEHEASATWMIPYDDFHDILASSDLIDTKILVDIDRSYVRSDNAFVEIYANNRRLVRIACDKQTRIREKLGRKWPSNWIDTHRTLIPLSTVLQVPILASPGSPRMLRLSRSVNIRVVAVRCGVRIRRVGLSFAFRPHPVAPWNRAGFVIPLAVIELAIMAAALSRIAVRTNRVFGWRGVAVFPCVMLGALVTHDDWDFSLWAHFIDMVLLGHQNPTSAWSATPLWALIPPLVTPLVALAPLLHLSITALETLAIKMLEFIAFSETILNLGELAKGRAGAMLASISLMSLYMLAFGTRDIVSSALAIAGIRACLQLRMWPATIFFICAVSVSEYFAPLLFMPTLITCGLEPSNWILVTKRFRYAVFGFAGVAIQWLLIDQGTRSHAVAFRFAQPEFAGATWQRIFAMQHLAPGTESLTTLILGYVFYGACLIALTVAALRNDRVQRRTIHEAVGHTLRYLIPAIAVFFLIYRGVDPQEWYGLVMILATGAAIRGSSFLPIAAFSMLSFLTIYSFTGLRAYIAPEFGSPSLATLFARDPGITNAFSLGAIAVLVSTCVSMLRAQEAKSTWTIIWMSWFAISISSVVEASVPIDPAVLIAAAFLTIFGVYKSDVRAIVPQVPEFSILGLIFVATVVLAYVWSSAHANTSGIAATLVIAAGLFAVQSGIVPLRLLGRRL